MTLPSPKLPKHLKTRGPRPAAAMQEPADVLPSKIEIRNLNFFYGALRALIDINMSLPDRSITAFIGPSGCGKSTLLRVMNRMYALYPNQRAEGEVLIGGRDILGPTVDVADLRYRVGMVFQKATPFPMSVFDNVAMVHEHSRLGGASRRRDVLDAIAFAGLDADPQARVRTLGAGQRRLVEVARAVVGRPRLVLLDEPAAGLPDQETSHLAEVIRRIPEHTGALAILVDHDMSLVSACCATTAVLDFGKLIASGPTAAVLRDDAVIRAYLGVDS